MFPSPAELRFIKIVGGKFTTINWIRWGSQRFPLAIVWTMGPLLKSEKIKREVKAGIYWIDFGNDIYRGIEIDGHEWHMDVVAEFERDSYLYTRGWRILHIKGADLWRKPDRVMYETVKFLTL